MDDSSYAGGGGKKSVSRLQQRKEMCKVHLEKDYSSCAVKNVTVGKQETPSSVEMPAGVGLPNAGSVC